MTAEIMHTSRVLFHHIKKKLVFKKKSEILPSFFVEGGGRVKN